MTTFLLILNIIMSIYIIINITDIKNHNTASNKNEDGVISSIANKFKDLFCYDGVISELDDYDDDDVLELPCDTTPISRLDNLRKRWDEEDREQIIEMCNHTFKDVYEFLDYVSEYNQKIINSISKEIHTIKYLDKYKYRNEETVLITFEDGSRSVFRPNVYAKYNII